MPQTLLEEARRVRENAYAPYSGFQVGAAVRGASGAIYVGCNVENAAYPQGLCAEAAAIAAMVAAGEAELVEIAVIADSATPISPCGGCRQKLAEFGAPEIEVTMATLSGQIQTQTLGSLLPGAFQAQDLVRSRKEV
ncbi:MAG: cytidine deaminase [Pseudomonadota bacterium]